MPNTGQLSSLMTPSVPVVVVLSLISAVDCDPRIGFLLTERPVQGPECELLHVNSPVMPEWFWPWLFNYRSPANHLTALCFSQRETQFKPLFFFFPLPLLCLHLLSSRVLKSFGVDFQPVKNSSEHETWRSNVGLLNVLPPLLQTVLSSLQTPREPVGQLWEWLDASVDGDNSQLCLCLLFSFT